MLRKFIVPVGVASALFCCSEESANVREKPKEEQVAFQPVPPRVYVAKVKHVLVGLAATENEIQAVEANEAAFGALVEHWMGLPEYAQKLQRFFELAFQQTQISSNDFSDQVRAQIGMNPSTTPLILQNVQQSFARTMVELTAQGLPLTEALTTDKLMMTTALKELYAFLDVWEVDNDGAVFDAFREKHLDRPIIVRNAGGPIPIEESVDPNSPNYLHWYNPDAGDPALQVPGCQQDPVSLPPNARALHYLLLGTIDGRRLRTGEFCQASDGSPRGPQFQASDFNDWTLVTIRQPAAGEERTVFFDLPKLRSARELVLKVPRVGFFSTPAFFANWQTNASNQMRVTLHQALIVATGTEIDGSDQTVAAGTPGLDKVHNQGACYSCHKILDPMRSIFSATWSWNYHNQLDETWRAEPGMFSFAGIIEPVSTVYEFGATLAKHPLVATGWVQKLCYYVNSRPCKETDPEFQRVAREFSESGLSFRTLIKTLVTSPLTTHARPTETALEHGEVIAVARRDHFCAALSTRLGLSDVCGLDALGRETSDTSVREIALGLPSDAYGRGAIAPILPNDPSAFFAAGVENICKSIANDVIDATPMAGRKAQVQWSSSTPDRAIADFVSQVMALTNADPRAPKAREILKKHYENALSKPNVSATDALRSTFVAACMAPSSVSIGL